MLAGQQGPLRAGGILGWAVAVPGLLCPWSLSKVGNLDFVVPPWGSWKSVTNKTSSSTLVQNPNKRRDWISWDGSLVLYWGFSQAGCLVRRVPKSWCGTASPGPGTSLPSQLIPNTASISFWALIKVLRCCFSNHLQGNDPLESSWALGFN